ncbi:MAG: glycosyltransferase family 2 protein [Armatimonadota bacterium]
MPSEQCISVIIPAYNEADSIAAAVRSALSIPGTTEVIVVDDGSADATAVLAQQAGAVRVISHPRNMGKGAAMNTGWRAANCEILLFLDADLGDTTSEGRKLVDPVLTDTADVTIAKFRRGARGGGLGLALRLARWGVKMLTGRAVEFPLSGQRCMRRSVIQAIGGFSPRFGVETAMTIDILRCGFRVLEVDTCMTHRITGRDAAGFIHRGRQLADIAWVLLAKAVCGRTRIGGELR